MNYIGSKHSLLDFLIESITSVTGDNSNKIFADVFAGTGTAINNLEPVIGVLFFLYLFLI